MKTFKINTQIISELGTFNSQIFEVNEMQLLELKKKSIAFMEYPFETYLDDGNYCIIPVDVLKKSIFKLNIINE